MSKSILVIDTPNSCSNCVLCEDGLFCNITGDGEIAYEGFDLSQGILPNCPLRPLPPKEICNEYDFEHYKNGVSQGWNNCIDKILGKPKEDK